MLKCEVCLLILYIYVLWSFYTYIHISFSRVGKFSSATLLAIITMVFTHKFSPSSKLIILGFRLSITYVFLNLLFSLIDWYSFSALSWSPYILSSWSISLVRLPTNIFIRCLEFSLPALFLFGFFVDIFIDFYFYLLNCLPYFICYWFLGLHSFYSCPLYIQPIIHVFLFYALNSLNMMISFF